MKKLHNKIAENSQAMIKIDTLIESRPEHEQDPGGLAYIARKVETSSIKKLYKGNEKNKNNQIIVVIACGVAVLALIAAVAFLIFWR